MFASLWNSSYSYKYRTEASTKAGLAQKGGIFYPQGKMLGGTSSLNAMLYVRGSPDDFNGWNVKGWTFDDVLPYFKKSEGNKHLVDQKFHGTSGPLGVSNFPNDEVVKAGILGGIAEGGYAQLNDVNAEQKIGFALVQGTLKDNKRCSSAKAFLSPLRSRPNVKVIKSGVVSSLIVNGARVEGVNFELSGRRLMVRARKEVRRNF